MSAIRSRAARFTLDTRSLTESIREHVVEGGLRYHAYHAGRYAFPNDEVEQERDDITHALITRLCDGRLFFAPVDEKLQQGAGVLDLGNDPRTIRASSTHTSLVR